MKKHIALCVSIVSLLFLGNLLFLLNIASAQQSSANKPANFRSVAMVSEVFQPGARALLIEDYCPWGCCSNEAALTALGIPYDLIHSASLANTNLCKYRFIMYASDQPQSYYNTIAANINKISAYVHDCCGLLIAHSCDKGWAGGYWTNILPADVVVGHQNAYYNSIHITDPSHCVVSGLDDTFFANWGYSVHGYFTNLPSGTNTIMVVNPSPSNRPMPTYIDYQYGQGRVWASMHTAEWGYYGCSYPAGAQFLLNELKCADDYKCGGCCEQVLNMITELTSTVGAIEAKNDKMEVKLDGLGRAVKAIEAKNDKMEVKLDSLGRAVNDLANMLKRLQDAAAKLEAKMDRPNVK
jgi:hypothetical protein